MPGYSAGPDAWRHEACGDLAVSFCFSCVGGSKGRMGRLWERCAGLVLEKCISNLQRRAGRSLRAVQPVSALLVPVFFVLG